MSDERFWKIYDEMVQAMRDGKIKLHGPSSVLRGMYESVERDVITSRIKLPPLSPETEEEIKRVYGVLTGPIADEGDNPNYTPITFGYMSEPGYILRYFSTMQGEEEE